MVIPTPTVKESDQIIYVKATRQFVINGTNFNPKRTDLIFEPALIRNQDYLLNVASKNTLVLTRTTGHNWRSDPGPLKLRRIDTGGGQLRVNPDQEGILVAEVQADLVRHLLLLLCLLFCLACCAWHVVFFSDYLSIWLLLFGSMLSLSFLFFGLTPFLILPPFVFVLLACISFSSQTSRTCTA